MIKKIGILTSGGDSPGMNAAVIGAVKSGIALGKEMYVVFNGYKGLVTDNFIKVDKHFIEDRINLGGTYIKTARLPEFSEESVRQKAVDALNKEGIEALIVVGGDGSYMGAKKLTEMGINCIGLPGTIDNDIVSTDFTIGFYSALNTIVDVIDNIKDTMTSHNRCAVIEIMGNHCPDLTTYAALATNADYFITIDHPLDREVLFPKMKKAKEEGQASFIILISEKGSTTAFGLTKEINDLGIWEARCSIPGHILRGGRPSGMERVNAITMGAYAVKLLDRGVGGVCVGIRNNKLTYQDIYDALKMDRNKHEDIMELQELISK